MSRGMTEGTEISYTAPVVVPQAGRIYRYDANRNASDRQLIFVTEATSASSDYPGAGGQSYSYGTWRVEGYRVTTGGVLTDEPVSLGGEIGRPYGVPAVAWCRRIGGDAGDLFRPVFSDAGADLFGASSLTASIEAQGRAWHIA